MPSGTGDDDEGLTVGELAAASGLTVRTLHHYDRLGLLVPSGRTRGGHRRYHAGDVAALYRIVALRGLGLSLVDIGELLGEQRPLGEALRQQLEDTARAIDDRQTLLTKLKISLAAVEASDEPSTEELLELISRTVETGPPTPAPSQMYRPANARGSEIFASFFEGVTSTHDEVRRLIRVLSPAELQLGVRRSGDTEPGSISSTRYAGTSSVGGLLVHTVVFEDDYVSRPIQSRSAQFEDAAWAETVGIDDLSRYRSCRAPAVAEPLPATFNPDGFARYAEAVFAATFQYASGLTDRELARDIPGPGRTALTWSMKVSELLAQVIGHSFMHTGQIATLASVLDTRRRSP